MKELQIGIIGTGGIGRDHTRRITDVITSAKVAGVTDIFLDVAKKVAKQYNTKCYDTAEEMINSPDIDALVICASDETHAEYVLKCIQANKPVLCEKPLATTAEECISIMQAENKLDEKLVQVGFMRRYDRDYRAMKKILDDGKIGDALLINAAHRNLTHIPEFTNDMVVRTTGIHEIDIFRWLTGEEYESVQVFTTKQNRNSKSGLNDPQIMMLTTKSGVRISVELNMTAGYGYDIQCEVVGETGTVKLPDPPAPIQRSHATLNYELFQDWSERFPEAYDIEIQSWVDRLNDGKAPNGPDSWDGYVACVVADAANKSRNDGSIVEKIDLTEKPEIYK